MKHLFKLKKDGKTIGYCKLLKYHDPLDNSRHWRGWGYSKSGKNWGQRIISFDTAHFFVTKDKNGKDVFAGDKVNWRPEELDELCQDDEELLEAEVAGGFLVFDVEGTDFVEASKFKDIELIEDKSK